MNKKIIYKGITCALLGATLLGGIALAPLNSPVEAATGHSVSSSSATSTSTSTSTSNSSSTAGTSYSNSTKQLCSHTTVKTSGFSTRNFSSTKKANYGTITVNAKKGTDSHTHTHTFTTNSLKSSGRWTTTGDEKGTYSTINKLLLIRTSKNGSITIRVNDSKAESQWAESLENNISSRASSRGGNSYSYKYCPDCSLGRDNAVSNFTVKCPYCSKKATINYQTGIIS